MRSGAELQSTSSSPPDSVFRVRKEMLAPEGSWTWRSRSSSPCQYSRKAMSPVPGRWRIDAHPAARMIQTATTRPRRWILIAICSPGSLRIPSMRSYIAPYVESFLPLFVAINPMGIIPIYLSVTESLSASERRRLTLQAMLTAVGLSVIILFAGQLIFSLLGITVNDLRVGGGLILLVLSISNLIFGDYRRR